MKNNYECRAECMQDVLKFMKKAKFQYGIQISKKTTIFPDVEIEIETSESIEKIIDVFETIEDSHVMIRTLKMKNSN